MERLSFEEKFGRSYGIYETYKTNDADLIIVGMGAQFRNVRPVIDSLRKEGKKFGMLRIRLYRPFPYKEIGKILDKREIKKILVLDRAISPGAFAPLYSEVSLAVDDKSKVSSVIAGLSGRDLSVQFFENLLRKWPERKMKKWV